MVRRSSIAVPFLVLLLASGVAGAAGAPRSFEVRLLAERFTPPDGLPQQERQQIGQRAQELRDQGKRRVHLLVQLREIPNPAERRELARQGLDLGPFVPDSAWIAAAPVGLAVAALARPEVRWATLWDAGRKLHPRIVAGDWGPWARHPNRSDWVAVLLGLHHDVPVETAAELAELVGGVAGEPVPGFNGVTLWLSESKLPQLAAQEEVLWIEEAPPPLAPVNDRVLGAMRANGLGPAPYGLDGSGVRLFVFDGGTVRTTHQTFDAGAGSRVRVIDGQPAASHATHVAGTAAGDGSGSVGGRAAGVAPAASILSAAFQQSTMPGSIPLWDNVGDIEADYALARNTWGADLGTNSLASNVAANGYGCNRQGDYGVSGCLLDTIVHGSDPAVSGSVIMTWAMGNERNAGELPGICGSNYRTAAPPACAKDPITVGAVNSDGLSMTDFSGWGPCDDGRLKPTVVAPGCETGLVTGESFVYSSTATSDSSYGFSCGTSMATPAVAGVAALLIDDWRAQGFGTATARPMPALIKGLLIHSAKDLGQEGPDYVYGYGAVDAKAAVDQLRSRRFVSDSVSTGGVDRWVFTVPSGTTEFKVTLVWDDPAAAAFAADALINDLDLHLVSPAGAAHKPWVLSPASPHLPATTGFNEVDNQEQVVVKNPAAGTWEIDVTGWSVPQAPQKYVLVYSVRSKTFEEASCTTISSTFETGTGGWTLSGAARTAAPATGHGVQSLRLGGTPDTLDEATLAVAVPAGSPHAELSFWWYMTTQESLSSFGFGFDPFTAEIRNGAGAVLSVADWRNDGWSQGKWMQQQKVDLTPWAGQTVTVALTASNDFTAPTTFWVDDVKVKTCPPLSPAATLAPADPDDTASDGEPRVVGVRGR